MVKRQNHDSTETIVLKCVPPFNFDLTVSLFSNGDSQIKRFDEGKFWQVLRVDNQLMLATLKSSGTIEPNGNIRRAKIKPQNLARKQRTDPKRVAHAFRHAI